MRPRMRLGAPRGMVPAAAARRLLIAGCALGSAPRKSTARSVLSLVRELGFVQVDSISSVERAHHLIMHARLDGYRPGQLANHAEKSRAVFEHWTHDASLIRSDWLPWWTCRFERDRRRFLKGSWMRQRLGASPSRTVRVVLGLLDASGPMSVRDMHDAMPARRAPAAGWWEWSPCKAALEYLWRIGEVAVHSRRGFEKVYDLAQRVHGCVPGPPSHDAHVDWACREALDRLGAATPRELAAFLGAITHGDAGQWCQRAILEGRVEAVALERAGRPPRPGVAVRGWKARADGALIDSTPRLLSPFDPLIRDRGRLLELFGFDYRFEAYVPAPMRRYGYYTMPVLVGERLVGRLDLATDRAAGTLRVDRAWIERSCSGGESRNHAKAAAERLAAQLGAQMDWRAGRR